MVLMERMKEFGFDNFLEIYGGFLELIRDVVLLMDYVSVDIKDESVKVMEDWKGFVFREVESIRILKEVGVKIYVKFVVISEMKVENV